MSDINEINKKIDQIETQINAIASTLSNYTKDFYDNYYYKIIWYDLGVIIYDWMTYLEGDVNEDILEDISTDYSKLKELKKLLIELYKLEIQL